MPQEPSDLEQDEAPAEIVSEEALEQRIVPFMGDDLAAARTEAGSIYLSLPGVCRALGLTTQAQLRRITRTPNLRRALRRIPLETRGGPQIVNCLRLDKVALWLAGIETLSVKEQYRAKIEAYQEDLAPLAMQVFMRSIGIVPAQPTIMADSQLAEQVAELAEQMDALTSVLLFMREHMNAQLSQLAANNEQINTLSGRLDDAVTLLEMLATRQETAQRQNKNAPATDSALQLTPAHVRAIQEQIDRMVQETRRLPSPLSHFMIYGRLKRRFHASSYREIPDESYEEVLDFLLDELRRALTNQDPERGGLF